MYIYIYIKKSLKYIEHLLNRVIIFFICVPEMNDISTDRKLFFAFYSFFSVQKNCGYLSTFV